MPNRFNEDSFNCEARLILSRFGGIEECFSSPQRESKIQSGSNVDFDDDDLVEVLVGGGRRVVVREGGLGDFDDVCIELLVTFVI